MVLTTTLDTIGTIFSVIGIIGISKKQYLIGTCLTFIGLIFYLISWKVSTISYLKKKKVKENI